eukprot:m.36384 g.36384  ORF g.36384 m.36384 type:complete len:610 (+) comp6666_c0_seq1:28-1857(+)
MLHVGGMIRRLGSNVVSQRCVGSVQLRGCVVVYEGEALIRRSFALQSHSAQALSASDEKKRRKRALKEKNKAMTTPIGSTQAHSSRDDSFMSSAEEKNSAASNARKQLFGGSVPFSEITHLHPVVLKNLGKARFSQSTSIQRTAFLPIFARKRNVAVTGETGCGKTLAYLLPITSDYAFRHDKDIHEKNLRKEIDDSTSGREELSGGHCDVAHDVGGEALVTEKSKKRKQRYTPKTVVIAPTRQLARAIFDQAEALVEGTHVRVVGIIGDEHSQTKKALQLKNRQADILVTVPGRLQLLMDEKLVRLNEAERIVVDEADYLLQEFHDDILPILHRSHPQLIDAYIEKLPEHDQLDILASTAASSHGHGQGDGDQSRLANQPPPPFLILIGATLATERTALLLKDLDNTGIVTTEMGRSTPLNIHHSFNKLSGPNPKPAKLLQETRVHLASKARVVVFCNQTSAVSYVSRLLEENNIPVSSFTSEMSKRTKEENMSLFHSKQSNVLICTDAMARGLNLEVDIVINYDLPSTSREYVHRSGRCGRIGKRGKVVNLIGKHERERAHKLESALHQQKDLLDVYTFKPKKHSNNNSNRNWFVHKQIPTTGKIDF